MKEWHIVELEVLELIIFRRSSFYTSKDFSNDVSSRRKIHFEKGSDDKSAFILRTIEIIINTLYYAIMSVLHWMSDKFRYGWLYIVRYEPWTRIFIYMCDKLSSSHVGTMETCDCQLNSATINYIICQMDRIHMLDIINHEMIHTYIYNDCGWYFGNCSADWRSMHTLAMIMAVCNSFVVFLLYYIQV